ncbi:MAG: pyruvate flavodoxin/ferredoxin oxidoreductase [bacterium]|nr:pyruvate flavodoxin/ferredoxin oxidoreductase [bacterium]
MGYEFINGAEAIVRASLSAGCDFFAGYPISPATEILIGMMRELPKTGGIAFQGEDEIASIAVSIAASMAGRKVMTATSGPGISLYSENIGLAIMGEVPLVIVNVQRLGPATGGATTGAQGDIQFVRWVTSGGLPMVVLCPSSLESLFELTVHAFNISEELRTPVILLTSKDMALSKQTLDRESINIPLIKNRVCFDDSNQTADFIPYKFDELSQVPLFLPIGAKKPVRFTTSMHDERGYLTKDPAKIERTFRHLEQKITANRNRIDSVKQDLEKEAEILLIAYGINAPLCREVMQVLRAKGEKCSLLIIESLFPEPVEHIKKALKGIKKVIIPELNTGLYAQSIKPFLSPEQKLIPLNKVNGDTFSEDEILRRISEVPGDN